MFIHLFEKFTENLFTKQNSVLEVVMNSDSFLSKSRGNRQKYQHTDRENYYWAIRIWIKTILYSSLAKHHSARVPVPQALSFLRNPSRVKQQQRMTHVNLFAKVGNVRRPKQSVPSVMIVSRASNPTAIPVKDQQTLSKYVSSYTISPRMPVVLPKPSRPYQFLGQKGQSVDSPIRIKVRVSQAAVEPQLKYFTVKSNLQGIWFLNAIFLLFV